jgi:2-methylcitrate dehydratase PrpD
MTVVDCARRIMENDWKEIKEVDIVTFGHAMIIVDTWKKNERNM